MRGTHPLRQTILALAGLAVVLCAKAEPGDAAAVSKARKDYAQAMRGHDAGLQNAMRVELAYQRAQAKERARRNAGRVTSAPASRATD